jgi:hypothetical protein
MRTAEPALAAASHSDAARPRVNILFLARHFTYFRNYESVIATLAERGHHLHLGAEREEDLGGREMVERLAREHQGVSFGWIPAREDRWATFATKLRMTVDYLRYLDPAYAGAPKLRARAKERVPRVGLWLLAAAGAKTRFGRRVTRAALHACERVIPGSSTIDEFLHAQRPDVVLFTPLIGVVASPQLDYLQSAKALGYPTALCVWSWDHLSSKAILRNIPDRVLVWNETQREEAVTLHGVPPERVVVTGAQCFDQWFERKPSTDGGTFCRRVGLADARPFLLYVCSALFQGSASEALFVQRWIRALRASRLEPLASTPIVVRPHPARMKEWADVDLAVECDVTLWGRNPVDPEAKTDYFDSLYHSAAVVGLNTSAFLEGAIAGRPVFATLLPEHHENQEGTIHFHYLLNVRGGLLHTARTLGDHFAQLNAALRDSERQSHRSRRFVEAFIRPHGLGVAAAPVFADEVEKLSATAPAASTETTAVRVLRGVLAPVAAFAALRVAEPLILSEHEREIAARHRVHRERVAAAWRLKDAHNASEQRHKEERIAERQRYKAERAADWRRAKTMKNLKQKLKKRIGLAS